MPGEKLTSILINTNQLLNSNLIENKRPELKDGFNLEFISRKYRNRRLGEFLKEYHLTEGKNTGFRKIRRALEFNGSPKPEFITYENRIQFITRIKIHPDFKLNNSIKFNGSLNDPAKAQAKAQANLDLNILSILSVEELSSHHLLLKLGHNTRSGGFKKSLSKLLSNKFIELTILNKIRSPNQKYRITKLGLRQLGDS